MEPSTWIPPLIGVKSPIIADSSPDLPDPVDPTIAVSCPGSEEKVTLRNNNVWLSHSRQAWSHSTRGSIGDSRDSVSWGKGWTSGS